MTMRKTIIALAIAALAVATPAAAQVSGGKPESIAEALRARGMTVEVTTQNGSPRLNSSVDGTQFAVFFKECKNGKDCRIVSFLTVLDVPRPIPFSKLNEFNRDKLFVRVFFDEQDGAPFLAMEVDVAGAGMSREAFLGYVDAWKSNVQALKQLAK